ncbi:T-cell receptor alpha chain V region HPB-MLT [Tupaia chinensis]|nr:T-cell receptor alpha chain V region HPB-MLT [Tupaia chinensis]
MVYVTLLWAVTVYACLGFSMAQTVTQSQSKMSVQETETVTLDCIYETSDSNYYLFWYQQPPSGQMIPIIRQEAFKQQNATEHRFSVNFQKEAKSFSLKISDSQLTDAAMYFCAFVRHRFSMAQTVTQSQSKMSVQETEVVILDCIYDTSERNYYLFWYQQPPSGQMIPIIRQEAFKQQNATEHRFSVNFQKEAKSFSLKISDSQLTDAAMYFCAFMRHRVSLDITLEPDAETLTVSVGEPATFRCSVTGGDLKNYQMSWYKKNENNSLVLVYKLRNNSNDDLENNFKGKTDTLRSQFILDIQKATAKDVGTYYCGSDMHSATALFLITTETHSQADPVRDYTVLKCLR